MKVIAALKSRFAKVDAETLARGLDALRAELNTVRQLALKEDAHRRIEETLAGKGEQFTRLMGDYAGGFREQDGLRPDLVQDLAVAWAVSTPDFAEAVHAAIDRNPNYSGDVTVAERDATVAELTQEIAALEAEQLRRELEAETAAREVEIQAKVAAIAAKASGEDAA